MVPHYLNIESFSLDSIPDGVDLYLPGIMPDLSKHSTGNESRFCNDGSCHPAGKQLSCDSRHYRTIVAARRLSMRRLSINRIRVPGLSCFFYSPEYSRSFPPRKPQKTIPGRSSWIVNSRPSSTASTSWPRRSTTSPGTTRSATWPTSTRSHHGPPPAHVKNPTAMGADQPGQVLHLHLRAEGPRPRARSCRCWCCPTAACTPTSPPTTPTSSAS